MIFLENDYLVPIFAGSDRQNLKTAVWLRKKYGFKVHFFAPEFTLRQKLFFECHTVAPFRFVFLEESLRVFSQSLPEYCCPLLIACDSSINEFIQKHGEALAPYIQLTDLSKLLETKEEETT